MKNYLLSVAFIFLFSNVIAQNSAEEKEVRKINEAFDQAIKNADVSFYENLLAPDYVYYSPDGNVKNRTQVLAEIKKRKEDPSYRITDIGSEDVKVKVSGNIAVVTAKWNATSQMVEDDETHTDTGHYIAVYEKNNGKWQLISEMGNEKPHSAEELEPSLKMASSRYDETIKNRDKEAFKKLLAEDYETTNNVGKVQNRDQNIEFLFNPDFKLESSSIEDKKFKVYRNFAVETGQYNVVGTYKGEKFSESGRYTSTWQYKDGKWQMVADHTSTIQKEQ